MDGEGEDTASRVVILHVSGLDIWSEVTHHVQRVVPRLGMRVGKGWKYLINAHSIKQRICW